MIAALRTFFMLWSPGLVILLFGLPALLRTGQVDPRAWTAPALLLILAAAGLKLRRGAAHAIWAGVGALGAVLLFLCLASWRPPEIEGLLWLTAVAALAVAGGVLLPARAVIGSAAALLALLVCWFSVERRVAPIEGERAPLAVISGLPLFWREGGGGLETRSDAPIITALRQRFEIIPMDSPGALARSQVDALLLAQPRALAPAELLAIDAWVRGGGWVVVLADPLLRWPSALPWGDRRRPPTVSLLAPLLAHWGLRLLPPSPTAEESRHFLSDGRLLTGFGVSGFGSEGGSCRVEAGGLLARCAIGRGTALLVADADLVDDRLWLADPAAPLDPRQWTADTPQFLTDALGGRALAMPGHWLDSEAGLIMATRWSILFGIFWAVVGSVLLGRMRRSISAREIVSVPAEWTRTSI